MALNPLCTYKISPEIAHPVPTLEPRKGAYKGTVLTTAALLINRIALPLSDTTTPFDPYEIPACVALWKESAGSVGVALGSSAPVPCTITLDGVKDALTTALATKDILLAVGTKSPVLVSSEVVSARLLELPLGSWRGTVDNVDPDVNVHCAALPSLMTRLLDTRARPLADALPTRILGNDTLPLSTMREGTRVAVALLTRIFPELVPTINVSAFAPIVNVLGPTRIADVLSGTCIGTVNV